MNGEHTKPVEVRSEEDDDVLWVVLDNNGHPEHVTIHKMMAHDHINDALGKRIDAGLWRVVKVRIES